MRGDHDLPISSIQEIGDPQAAFRVHRVGVLDVPFDLDLAAAPVHRERVTSTALVRQAAPARSRRSSPLPSIRSSRYLIPRQTNPRAVAATLLNCGFLASRIARLLSATLAAVSALSCSSENHWASALDSASCCFNSWIAASLAASWLRRHSFSRPPKGSADSKFELPTRPRWQSARDTSAGGEPPLPQGQITTRSVSHL